MKKIIASFALLALAACIHNPSSMPAPPETTLKVQNDQFLDMNIYVVRPGERLRLGTATGGSTRIFRIPARIIFGPTPLRFQADPIGASRQPITEEITVSAGDEVTMIIPPS